MKAVLIGTGKIGRGIIAKSLVNAGCSLTMVDANAKIIDILRNAGKYTVRSLDDTTDYTEVVRGYQTAPLPSAEAETAVVEADIIFVSVGVNNLPSLMQRVTPYLIRRVELDRPPVDMIFCENFVGVSARIGEILRDELGIDPAAFTGKVGFAGGSVGVVVPPSADPLYLIKGPYEDIHIEEHALITPIRIPHFVPVDNFELCIREKLYIYNMAHALTSYLGWLHGYEYVDEAYVAPGILGIVRAAMDAVAQALAIEYHVPCEKELSEVADIERRIRNRQIRDTVVRIAEDPARKLSFNDRLVGAYRLTQKHGIPSRAILEGIAAGFLFAEPADKSAMKIQKYIRQHGVTAAVKAFTGLKDEVVILHIAGLYRDMKESFEVHQQ